MKHKVAYLVGGVWLVVAVVAWLLAVPSAISTSTFLWVNVAVLGLVVTLPVIVRDSQPSRSMAGILYDTEHPEERR